MIHINHIHICEYIATNAHGHGLFYAFLTYIFLDFEGKNPQKYPPIRSQVSYGQSGHIRLRYPISLSHRFRNPLKLQHTRPVVMCDLNKISLCIKACKQIIPTDTKYKRVYQHLTTGTILYNPPWGTSDILTHCIDSMLYRAEAKQVKAGVVSSLQHT